MNKINPLYILLLFVVITFGSFKYVNSIQELLIKSNQKLTYFQKDVLEYNRLKSIVTHKKEILKLVDSIINNQELKKADISSVIKRNKVIVKITTSDRSMMQIFLNKFLNKSIKIDKMVATKKYLIVEVAL